MDASALVTALLVAAQFIAAMWVFSRSQPRRPRFATRWAACSGAYVLGTVVATWVGQVGAPQLMTDYALFSQITAFCALAVVWLCILLACYDVTPVGAAFVCVGGYSAQNLADNVQLIAQIVWREAQGGWPVGLDGTRATAIAGPLDLVLTALASGLVFYLCDRFFARRLTGGWADKPNDWKIVLMFAAVLFFEIAFDLTLKSAFALPMFFAQRVLLAGAKLLLCVFMLFAEYQILVASRAAAEADAAERVARERERQYELQRANVEAINVKVHDIKHQIRALAGGAATVNAAVLEDLAHEVRVFDTSIKTGNDAIDTILTEKLLACEQAGVTLGCIVDGAALSFMPAAELYALFGNALDNAVRAAAAVADPARRSISLTVAERAGMVCIHVENYFDGELHFEGGLPVTTKADASGAPDTTNHGFGTRSMQLIAESHGGVLTTSAQDGVFYLNVMIPAE